MLLVSVMAFPPAEATSGQHFGGEEVTVGFGVPVFSQSWVLGGKVVESFEQFAFGAEWASCLLGPSAVHYHRAITVTDWAQPLNLRFASCRYLFRDERVQYWVPIGDQAGVRGTEIVDPADHFAAAADGASLTHFAFLNRLPVIVSDRALPGEFIRPSADDFLRTKTAVELGVPLAG